MTRIFLKNKRDESIKRYHPWVFSGAVKAIESEPQEGDIVQVCSDKGDILAYGHYQIGSIAVRILSFEKEFDESSFWKERIVSARRMRESMGIISDRTNCYRLVHGEGDMLPGLIIDWYDGIAVMQAHSAGMFRSKQQITEALQHAYGNDLKAVYDKSEGTAPFKAGLDLKDGYIYKSGSFDDTKEDYQVLENGKIFNVNWIKGQKTGFFLDQRENRKHVGELAKGKNVLNLFCYTGGFSIYALKEGAKSVTSVDSSRTAMDMVDKNVLANGFDPANGIHTSVCADAIEYLRDVPKGKFDLMIVDPPAFAKHRGALNNALRAYQRLNAQAIEKVASGGIIFTFSCSQVVDKQAFALAVFSAAAQTGRRVRIIGRMTQPCDHPVNIYHPEGEYLKGLVIYVE